MQILIRFLLFLIIGYLLQRFFLGLKKPQKKAEADRVPAEASNQMVKDPVCGMYMDARLAIRIENRDQAIYFCSEECKKQYLAAGERSGTAAAS